jgi:hypothetical protein
MSDRKGNDPPGDAGLDGEHKDENEVVNPLGDVGNDTSDAADASVFQTEISAEEHPDVPAPMEWFEGGLCAALQLPAVYWAAQFVLVALVTGVVAWGVVLEGGLTADVAILVFFGGMTLLAWAVAPALAALRDAGRPETGALALLARLTTEPGGDGPTIAVAARASLVRWRRGAFGIGLLWCGLGTIAWIPQILDSSFPTNALKATMWVWMSALGVVVPLWYTSLRLACALAGAAVERIAAAVAAPGAGALSDAEWATQVQESAVALAEDVLPALSRWGPSLAALAVALGALALGLVYCSLQWNNDPMTMVFAVLLSFAAFGLVLVPATVSTECERMIGELNALRKHAGPVVQAQVSALESFLKGCNREQGIGFKVFGAVINRQQLKVFFAKTWALIFGAWVFLGPLINPPLPNLDPSSSLSFCEPDWHHADGSCFHLPSQVDTDWKTWPEAEAACQERGGNLASIASEAQSDVVTVLLAEAEGLWQCWIGLTDAAEEGAWVWSDGEPATGFTDWKGSQPNNHIPDDPRCAASLVGEDCAGINNNGWEDWPCEFVSRKPGGEGEIPGMSGCYQNRNPFACSKPATPSKAHGGPMHGCRNGGWMMGTAHANPGLPPTIVRVESPPHRPTRALLMLPSSSLS